MAWSWVFEVEPTGLIVWAGESGQAERGQLALWLEPL